MNKLEIKQFAEFLETAEPDLEDPKEYYELFAYRIIDYLKL